MADGQPFVIWVVIDVKPEAFEAFYEAALGDSTCSVRDEPGCLQFDVLAPIAGGNIFAFYEVYESKEAFSAHMETPHFKRFASVAEEAVSAKQASEYFRLQGVAKPFQP
jgi:quinol monooxygenase YgiN